MGLSRSGPDNVCQPCSLATSIDGIAEEMSRLWLLLSWMNATHLARYWRGRLGTVAQPEGVVFDPGGS